MLLVLLCVVIIATVVFAAISMVTTDARAALQEQFSAEAYYLARAGVTEAIRGLRDNSGWGTSAVAFKYLRGTVNVTSTGNNGNSNNNVKMWTVCSVATTAEATRTIYAYCLTESFAKYAYFSQVEPAGTYYRTGMSFGGPVHTNGHFSFMGTPAFADKTTSANADEQSSPPTSGYPFDPAAFVYDASRLTDGNATSQIFTSPSSFYHAWKGDYQNNHPVATGASAAFSFAGGQPAVTMPSSLTTVSGAATYSFTGASTVVFNANGTAAVTSGGTTTTVSTYPTATLYCKKGNVTVSGTVHGSVTLGADGVKGDTASGNVVVADNLVYADKTRDTLGLVAYNNVHVSPGSTWSGKDPSGANGLEIDGSIIAVLGEEDVSNPSQPYAGTLTIFGGLINYQPGVTGTMDSSGNVVSGFRQVLQYDSRLQLSPPPNYPITGAIVVKGLVDTGALGR